jgi:hypothetical protein
VFVDPTSISGLQLWADFGDLTTLFQDTARTSPITADAQIIKGVTDKSGQGKHLTEATNGPTYKENIQNGLSIARFDDNNDALTASLSGLTAWTIFLLLRTASGTADDYVLNLDTSTNEMAFISGFVDNKYEWYEGAASRAQIGNNSAVVFNNIVVTRPAHSGTYATYLDGTPGATGATTVTAHTGFVLGFIAGNVYGGDIAEIVVYDSVLSTNSLNNVGSYMDTKWGLTWTPVT